MVFKLRWQHAICTCVVHAVIICILADCLVWATSLLLGSAVDVSAGNAARSLAEEAESRTDRVADRWSEWAWLIEIGIAVVVFVVEIAVLLLYWCCFIKPTADKYIPTSAVIPADLKNRWLYGIFDCCSEALGTCLCFTFFPVCASSDLWYRAGWIHATLDGELEPSHERAVQCCPGWQFFVGCCGFLAVQEVAPCCFPCLSAALRGGVPGQHGDLGLIVDHTKRFELPNEGWSTFWHDCCCHCLCGPCVNTQEYRQVMAVLDRGAHTAQAATVVGQPVTVVGQKA